MFIKLAKITVASVGEALPASPPQAPLRLVP
jgi:hypothetical protein